MISHRELWAESGGSSPAPCGRSRVCGVAGARGDICDVAGGNGETSVLLRRHTEEGGERRTAGDKKVITNNGRV